MHLLLLVAPQPGPNSLLRNHYIPNNTAFNHTFTRILYKLQSNMFFYTVYGMLR
jgi:hypothetical protein